MAPILKPALALAAFLCLPIGAQASDAHFEGNQGYPTVWDPNNPAFQGVTAMTVGQTYTAGRSIALNCSAAGNVSLKFTDGTSLVVPVPAAFQTLPFAVTSVNSSGTTATCTYAELK